LIALRTDTTDGGAVARAIWTGSLSFGLVSIPVRLHNATIPKDVRFHQVDRSTGRRIHHRRVVDEPWVAEELDSGDQAAPVEAGKRADRAAEVVVAPSAPRQVSDEEIVRGFEIADSRYVRVTEEELRALRPEQTHTILIEEFVPLQEIDPVYFEKSYYLTPQRGAEKPYVLLVRAMERAGRVAVARFVLRTKEHLTAIRPGGNLLVLETLFFSDEVVPASDVEPGIPDADLSAREIDMAEQLVELLATSWDPSRYRDTYREGLLELIEGKAGTAQAVAQEPAPRGSPQVSDLLAALRASVEAVKREERPSGGSRRRRPTG
jgi:DNA end-binding protein Ku